MCTEPIVKKIKGEKLDKKQKQQLHVKDKETKSRRINRVMPFLLCVLLVL